ncbi:MAG: nitroreductase/quinone reductase family protein [Anaerolineae bacterium]|nr:nitroreductase/quinone reductase family protein [Anaerolineae bacterium]
MTTYKSEFLYVTTTGHKTGTPHEIEIWFCEHEGGYYLCAEHRERTHWVQNIQHNPVVTFWVNEQTYKGRGRVIDPAAEPELAKAVSGLFDAKYNWSDGLLVELRPD